MDRREANGTLGDEYVRYNTVNGRTARLKILAADLMEKFPSLTPAQIATRIKSTASYSGLTGSGGQTSANRQQLTCKQSLVMD